MKDLISKIKSSVIYSYFKIILPYSIFIILGLILLFGQFVNALILIKDIILVIPWLRAIGFGFGIIMLYLASSVAYEEIKEFNKKRKAGQENEKV